MTQFIDGKWVEGTGARFASHDPATGEEVWVEHAAEAVHVDDAIRAAANALPAWADCPEEERLEVIGRFKLKLEEEREGFARLISRETGKTLWESRGELGAMIGKIDLSVSSHHERCKQLYRELPAAVSVTRHRPHGVLAVFGPFNFPGHLPNGHIVPALIAGNTLIFKPSDVTPAVGQKMLELWEAAGLPPGVLNLVQGGRDVGIALAQHPGINGLLFTGSSGTGLHIHQSFAAHPEKMLALEMGGNNPLVIWEPADLRAAAYVTVQSAYITSGQRCTCARRLIVPQGDAGDALIETLIEMMAGIRVGAFTEEPEPYMGPLVSKQSAERAQSAQRALESAGGVWLRRCERPDPEGAFLTPGLMDVTGLQDKPDEEIFAPFLQVTRVEDFDEAIEEANDTRYGLAAGLISKEPNYWRRFYRGVRAGIVNWNTQTTGASSAAPFGGVGISGNHRPSAYYAADYCSYPVASMEVEELRFPEKCAPGIVIDEDAVRG